MTYQYIENKIEELEKRIEALEQESCDELDFVQPHKKISVNLELCDDAISRQATIDEVSRIVNDHPLDGYEDGQLILKTIQDMPPVTPAKKAGRWIEERTYMKCPNCYDIWHYEENQTERFRHCPTCGRKMEVEVKE